MRHAPLFDLDGTLVDTMHLYVESLIEGFAAAGITYTRDDFDRTFPTGMMLEEYLAAESLDPGLAPVIGGACDEAYLERLRNEAKLYPGVERMLDTIASRPHAIITGSRRRYVDAICARIPRLQSIPTITREDMHPHHKPHPHGLLLAMQRLNLQPEQCVYVGDQPFDIEAATRAKMLGILLRTGHTPPEYAAKYEAGSHAELLGLL